MGFQQLLGVGFPAVTPFTPSSISGLNSWYDAQDSATITQSGGKVSAWSDKGPSAINLSQAKSAQQPSYSATGFNTSYPAITFSAAGANLFAGSRAISSLTEDTVFFVGQCTAAGVKIAFGSGAATVDMGYGVISSSAAQYYNGATPQLSSGNVILTTDLVYLTFKRTTAGVNSFRKNGIDFGTTTTATPTMLAIGTNTIIGTDGFGDDWTGPICEVILYNRALNSTEVGQVESYLKTKWGL